MEKRKSSVKPAAKNKAKVVVIEPEMKDLCGCEEEKNCECGNEASAVEISEPDAEECKLVEETPAKEAENEAEIEMTEAAEKDKKAKKTRMKKVKLCKLVKKKFLEKHMDEYREMVENPTWVCKKCGRASNNSKNLCKPTLINKVLKEEKAE